MLDLFKIQKNMFPGTIYIATFCTNSPDVTFSANSLDLTRGRGSCIFTSMFMEFGRNLQNCTGNKSDVEDARFLINTLHYIFTGRMPDFFSYIPHFNRWQATICLI